MYAMYTMDVHDVRAVQVCRCPEMQKLKSSVVAPCSVDAWLFLHTLSHAVACASARQVGQRALIKHLQQAQRPESTRGFQASYRFMSTVRDLRRCLPQELSRSRAEAQRLREEVAAIAAIASEREEAGCGRALQDIAGNRLWALPDH
jgi:hypothetical protein